MQNMAIKYNFCLHSGMEIVLIRTINIISCVTNVDVAGYM